jgi:hypothetical protein
MLDASESTLGPSTELRAQPAIPSHESAAHTA